MTESSDRVAGAVERLREQGTKTLIVAGADTYGMMRGKRLPTGQAARAFDHGIPMSDVFWVMHIDEMDIVARPEGHAGYFPTEKEGYPDILAVADLATLRPVPWHERTAIVLADFALQDGRPVPIAPRTVLKGVVGAHAGWDSSLGAASSSSSSSSGRPTRRSRPAGPAT